MMRKQINDNVDYLYNLQKDETEHQDHRSMWILTAQALIFTGLCALLPQNGERLHTYIIILLILVGVLLSISGIYSMLISKTAIGTVYERWNKYNSYFKKKKKQPLHHLVSLAPSHFLRSKINWLMFCYFAPNVFCATWITLLLTYLLDKYHIYEATKETWPFLLCLFAVLLIIVVGISQFLGKFYLYHWGYDQYHEKKDEDVSLQYNNCTYSNLYNERIIHCDVGYNENGVMQNSFNDYSFSTHSWKDLKIYHIMIDRFNGVWNTSKDNGNFLGGTIRGIIERIDYIQEQGCNAILLTPIFKSTAYHGYHTTDYETIDEHFGTWADFDELVDTLHKKGMRLLCDYVPNHCHINHPFFQSALNDSSSPYRNWFYFDTSREGGFVSYQNYPDLPKFNLYDNAAADYLISIAIMLAKRGVDGLRIDHVIGVPFGFLVKLRQKIKEINPNLFLFGEARLKFLKDLSQVEFISTKQKNKAYKGKLTQEEIQLNYVNYLDGILDFKFRDLLKSEVKNIQKHKSYPRLLGNKTLEDKIRTHLSKYPSDFQLILFLDNHDTNRFLFHCKGNKSLLQESLTLCRNFYSQPYSIYYGTERFMMNKTDIHDEPYGDEDVREPMEW